MWDGMVTTGKIDESYIEKVWEAHCNRILHQHREYLLLLLQRLDIIAKPKVYDDGGFDTSVGYFYVPCMLQVKVRSTERLPKDEDITISFKFKELLPPAVVHKVFASCICLWSVQANCLYDGWALLESGPNHLILLDRHSNSITVSVRHRQNAGKVELSFLRSIKHFFAQTIQRIVSAYGVQVEKGKSRIYEIECNKNAITKGIGSEDKVRHLI